MSRRPPEAQSTPWSGDSRDQARTSATAEPPTGQHGSPLGFSQGQVPHGQAYAVGVSSGDSGPPSPNTPQGGRSQSRRGAAPISDILIPDSSSSPTTSTAGPATSARDRMQISPDTILAPPVPPLATSSELLRAQSRQEYLDPARGFSQGDTLMSGTSPAQSSRYRLTILQQPEAARACGHGERDRRVIDPPPILQLSLVDYNHENPDDVGRLCWNWNIVQCLLYSVADRDTPASEGQDVTQIPDPNNKDKTLRRLMGTITCSPFIGTDRSVPDSAPEAARIRCYYIFHDLSCRQTGLYRLHFMLTSVNMNFIQEGSRSDILASAVSDVFEVFSAKEFPGMKESTALTKELKQQGATVAVKKGNEAKPSKKAKKRGGETDGSGSEGSDEPGPSGSAGQAVS